MFNLLQFLFKQTHVGRVHLPILFSHYALLSLSTHLCSFKFRSFQINELNDKEFLR